MIRDDTDRGLVLLIDDRFTTFSYRRLLPDHWNGFQVVPDPIGGFQPDPVVLGGTALCGRYSGASGRSHQDSQQPHAVGQALLIQETGFLFRRRV